MITEQNSLIVSLLYRYHAFFDILTMKSLLSSKRAHVFPLRIGK